MKRIILKDGSREEFISSDLFKAVDEFSEVLREKLGDDSERIFREILSDTFDFGVTEAASMNEPGFGGYVKNPFFQ